MLWVVLLYLHQLCSSQGDPAKWEGFSATQREMIRLILMGVQQGILEHWGIFSDVTTRVIDGISREEILAVQFEPIIPL